MRGIGHSEKAHDNVDSGSLMPAQSLHPIRLHDRIRSVEPLVANEKEEEECSLTKLEELRPWNVHQILETNEGFVVPMGSVRRHKPTLTRRFGGQYDNVEQSVALLGDVS